MSARHAAEQIEHAFALCREVGIHTVAYFMIGTPTERSRQDVVDTIDYSIRLKPDFVMYNILTPFPGTALLPPQPIAQLTNCGISSRGNHRLTDGNTMTSARMASIGARMIATSLITRFTDMPATEQEISRHRP